MFHNNQQLRSYKGGVGGGEKGRESTTAVQSNFSVLLICQALLAGTVPANLSLLTLIHHYWRVSKLMPSKGGSGDHSVEQQADRTPNGCLHKEMTPVLGFNGLTDGSFVPSLTTKKTNRGEEGEKPRAWKDPAKWTRRTRAPGMVRQGGSS